jgi:hypothetical protein
VDLPRVIISLSLSDHFLNKFFIKKRDKTFALSP